MKKLIIVLATLISSCGIKEAIQAVPEMSKKLDKTNEKLDQTQGSLDGTDNKIATTGEDIRRQAISVALEGLFDEKNTRSLNPPTSKLFIYSKSLAEHIHTDEILPMVRTWLIDLNNKNPEDVMGGKLTEEQKFEWDYSQRVTLTVLTLVTAQLSTSMIQEISNSQLMTKGMYERSAKAIMVARTLGLQTYLLEPLTKESIDNLETLDKVVGYLDEMAFIYQAPYKNKLSLVAKGFFDKELEVEASVADGIIAEMADLISSKIPTIIHTMPGYNSRFQTLMNRLEELKKVE